MSSVKQTTYKHSTGSKYWHNATVRVCNVFQHYSKFPQSSGTGSWWQHSSANYKQLKGSVKEPNKFHIYETEKITRKASDALMQQNI